MLQSVLQRLVVVVLVEIRRVTVQTSFKKLGHKRHLWSRGDGGDTKRKSGQKHDQGTKYLEGIESFISYDKEL